MAVYKRMDEMKNKINKKEQNICNLNDKISHRSYWKHNIFLMNEKQIQIKFNLLMESFFCENMSKRILHEAEDIS